MVQNWFMLQLENLGIKNNLSFQRNGVPAHYALAVREYPRKDFREHWIGRQSQMLPASFDWLPRSADSVIIFPQGCSCTSALPKISGP
jgi:hypothetical protein